MFRRTLAGLAAVGIIALASGCAEEQPIIDRTEANALSKSLFTGEWFYNQTVVDAPNLELPAWIPIGSTNYSGAKRVRWDIQEGWLYARKSYEHIRGASREDVNGQSTAGTGDETIDENTGEFKGSIVGAWRITSHFDVRRSYNPTTGQEINVLSENASDCKWYDCKYMRVDWSQNHAVDYMFLDYDEDLKKQAMPFYFQDEADPRFKPVFDEKAGYIDVVTAMAMNPGQVSFRWGGRTYTYPLCWLFGHETAECNTIAIKLRNSFWRRHPNRDYRPRSHQGAITEWFGFFTNDRLIWDNKWGILETHKQRVINRHNIWEKWHYEDQPCRTDDDCQVAGSECDTMIKFFKVDTWTDTDVDSLPDEFEKAVGLNPKRADSDGDGVVDRLDDAVTIAVAWADGVGTVTNDKVKNGRADLQDYYDWAQAQKEYRCTIPMAERAPRPPAYFNTGYFPRDQVCDAEDAAGTGPCKQWTWSPDKAVRESHESTWSVVHQVSNNYDEMMWRVYLRGGYGWSQEKLDRWIETHNPNDGMFTDDDRNVLSRFGDINDPHGPNGLYAFSICPNNPPQDYDPWPCRFNKASWAEAQKAMQDGKDTIENRPLVRRGDMRFSQINYVSGYSQGLLGLGPSHTDPVTGENFAGVANVYHLNDVAANSVREMVKLLNGEMSAKDYIDGMDINKWIAATNLKKDKGAFSQKVSYDKIRSGYKATVQDWMKRIQRRGTPEQIVQASKTMSNRQIRGMLGKEMLKSGLYDPAKYSAPGLELIRGTDIEKRLIDNEVLMASGYAPSQINPTVPAEITDDVLNRASLARGGFVKMIDAQEQFRTQVSERLNMYFLEMADDAMMGLATRLKGKSDDEVFKAARRIIMRAVLTHEMGHTVGLHHNWAGSEDVVNFFPEYWRLRTNDFQDTQACTGPWTRSWDINGGFGTPAPQAAPQPGDGKLCPFFIKPMNAYQLGQDGQGVAQGLRSMHEYSYSSIMDYAGRYTIDGSGLGRYDKAAVMYGHVDKVEVYDESPMNDITTLGVNGPIENWFEEWFSGAGSATIFYSTPKAFHYVNWWPYMGSKMYDEKNRMVVDYRQVEDLTDASGRSYGSFYKVGNKIHPRVPYLFCTYTRGDISDGCNTRDYGADQWERMKQHVDNWETYYPLRSFTRYRYGMSPESYIGRNYRRVYRRLKDFNNSYALYQGLFRQWFTEEAAEGFFTDVTDGWASYTLALNDGFNMAMRTLAMPDIKPFQRSSTPDGQTIYNEAAFGTDFVPDLTNARYFTTSYNNDNYDNVCGLTWWECLHHIGFYTDKIMALLTLSDSRTYFVGQDTAEDVREYRISFFDNYTRQMVDFIGSVLGQTYDAHSPWYSDSLKANPYTVDSNGTVWRYGIAWRNYADPTQDPPRPSGALAVEPATRFTLQMYLMVIGMLNLQTNFDNEFVERSLMWKSGATTGWDITPNSKVAGTVSFVDPFSGYTYVAADYIDGRGISQKMIAYANKLKANMADPKAEGALYDFMSLMDIQTRLTERFRAWATWNWYPFRP